MSDVDIDAVVVGAGVVGLAVARHLAERGCEVFVLERAPRIGSETSSRNSEVIHAGIYYPPASLKAELCVAGKLKLYDYLRRHHIDHRQCGKLVVATEQTQIDQLRVIEDRARAAGVHDLTWLGRSEIGELEPNVRAVAGLLSPSTGILDTHGFMTQLRADLEALGGMVILKAELLSGQRSRGPGFELSVASEGPCRLRSRYVVNAAGLHAREVLSRLLGGRVPDRAPQQYYAIGHYYGYHSAPPFQRLVYPTPDRDGLGVHATLDISGQVRFGPDVRWLERIDYAFDDSQREAFVEAIRRYFPHVRTESLQPGYTGIRPKLKGPGEGPSDFCILTKAEHGLLGLVSLHGIESPGLTAALALAERVGRTLFEADGE